MEASKKVLSFRVEPEKEEELAELAEKTGLTVSDLLRTAVDLLLQLSDYLGSDNRRIKKALVTLAKVVGVELEDYKKAILHIFSALKFLIGEVDALKYKLEALDSLKAEVEELKEAVKELKEAVKSGGVAEEAEAGRKGKRPSFKAPSGGEATKYEASEEPFREGEAD